MEMESIVQQYENEIRNTGLWYSVLWRSKRKNLEYLFDAGREAVIRAYEKDQRMANCHAYVNGAIRIAVLGKRAERKIFPKRLHLVRREDNGFLLIDALPAYRPFGEEVKDIGKIVDYLRQTYSDSAADGLIKAVERCETVFDMDLSKPSLKDMKDRIRLATEIDLDDRDMMIYARVLVGALKKYPNNTVVPQHRIARKYVQSLLSHLGMTPLEFAQFSPKKETLTRYCLWSFVKEYDGFINNMLADVFPEVEPYRIQRSLKWSGIDGLVNALNAIGRVVRLSKKDREHVFYSDFKRFGYGGLMYSLFGNSPQRAIEFRYPGTFPEHRDEMEKLRDEMMKQ